MADSKEKNIDADLERSNAEFLRAAKSMTSDEFASPTPLWYRVIMFSLMILGVLWIMTFYISNQVFPIPGIGVWNIGVGIGLMMVGMLMTTRWR